MAAGGSKRGSGVADPLSGLTRDDVRLVQGHWRAIEQNLAAVGVDVFVTMFTNHPEYQQLFRSLAHLPLEALRRHKALESHGATVMQALTRVVDGLARPDADLRVMRDQGRLHAKWHVKEFHFLDLRREILEVLARHLEDKMDDRALAAWGRTLDFMFSGLLAGLEEGIRQSKK